MSDAHDQGQDPAYEPNHEGPIKTPKQLILAVLASFLVPIFGIYLLVNYVDFGGKPGAGSESLGEEAIARRLQPIGNVTLREARAPGALRSGQEVYAAACGACHGAGVGGAPKLGDSAAWAPRIKTGYEVLLTSALKGKGAMAAQGGGQFTDIEIGGAVVHMANQGGAKFDVPKAPAAAGSAASAAQ
ncbi:MAG: cytochrome c5 family protein [Leptothrix sp. (in: Bacteria)]|nr:cytochrome c5 family protein [Leptothrix sp. (in: b-proteobacteria)]